MTIDAPVPLADQHDLTEFNSGVDSLDEWLRRRSRGNQATGASRTFVACEGPRVVAYYALASGAVNVASATGRLRRNMPDPIPVAVLGRLAVDRVRHGHGIGRALFGDAACRVFRASDLIGIRGLLVHAISEEAKAFYVALGLSESPLDPMTLMVSLADLRAAL
ncbi:MAG: GNAT family N-acetyltransferase [Xanthobacteraceae bacterium]|nr:GNAT family N-acetyltransferase [Xanthobacteraceae bacterium]